MENKIIIEQPLTVNKLKTILEKLPDNAKIYLDVNYANTDGFNITAIIYNNGEWVEFVTDAVLK
ncbi:hypothetical protein [Allocoleopsis franciscana]|uniref:Uncharacterized protein n=1 Tax=Allocoleopsis franciscana PCC 7113 TaxID=1173027 RepID=K9WK70_9CYAN|nr:hypothetical protein [Allocoleopsis franciscana]AFZ20563.1 hypothetical protein Mic7113_4899 [Allocoleopsis franciscana PCC 7113]